MPRMSEGAGIDMPEVWRSGGGRLAGPDHLDRVVVDPVHVHVDAETKRIRQMAEAVAVDRQRSPDEPFVVERLVALAELAVLDRQRHMQVRRVEQRRTQAVDLEVVAEELGSVGCLSKTG